MKKIRLFKLGLLIVLLFGAGTLFSQKTTNISSETNSILEIAVPFNFENPNFTFQKGTIIKPSGPVDLIITDGMIAGADYLQHAQADVTEDNAGNGDPDVPDDPDDAGWDWRLTSPAFTHSTTASSLNLYGVTALGLYYAYLETGDAGYLTAMQDAATIMVGNTGIKSGPDLIFLMNFQDITGVTPDIYQDAAKAKFDARIATHGGTATTFAVYIRDARAGQGYENGIIPWDIAPWAVAAQMLEARYPSDPYDYATASVDIAEVLWQDSFNDTPGYFDIIDDQGWDPPNFTNKNFWWYTLGITGLIDAFHASGSYTSEIPGLLTILFDCQYSDGAFSYSYGANPDDASWQATAYSVHSLARVDQATHQDDINDACFWLLATQDATSGGWVYGSGNHYPEVGAENTTAMYFGDSDPTPVITIETPTSVSCGVYEVDITVEDFTLVGSISMTLEYDDLVLQYAGIVLNPAIAGSSYNDFLGTFILGGWYTPAFTLPDDAVLFTLTFNVLQWGVQTTLHWPTTPPEANEISGPNGDPVYVDSFFDITFTLPDDLGLSETHIDADCQSNPTGSIDLTVTGGVTPYTYSWTGPNGFMSTSEDLTGLYTGTYDVLVTDANGCTETLPVFVGFDPDVTDPVIVCPADMTVNNDPGVCEAVVDFMPATTESIPPNPNQQGYTACRTMWQSFKPLTSGVLTGIDVDVKTAYTAYTATVDIYAGEGTSGCLLYTCPFTPTASGPYTISIPKSAGVFLAAGQLYTISITGTCTGCTTCVDLWVTWGGTGSVVYADGYYWDNTFSECGNPYQTPTQAAALNCTFYIDQLPTGMSVLDNCVVRSLIASPLSGSTFSVGTTTVTFTAYDCPGNSASCTFDVTVNDNENPSITCATPAATYNADPGVCDYTVTGPPPVFVAPKIDYFWMAMDGTSTLDPLLSGGIANDPGEDGLWHLYYQDPPGVWWWNIWFYNEPYDPDRMKIIRMGFWIQPFDPLFGANFNYVVNWSTDGWTGPGFPLPPEEIFVNRSPLNNFILPLGSAPEWVELYWVIPDYNPEWVSVDIWGENIIIEQAAIAPPALSPLFPWWDPAYPGGIIVHECLPKAGAFLDPIFFDDNCGIASVVNNWNGLSTLNGATFPVGTHTVIWTVYDIAGNSASCQYDVVVVDNQPPTITCAVPANPYYVNTGCTYVVPGIGLDPTATGDNCGILSVINSINLSSTLQGAVFPIGTTNVIWTITDVATPPNVTTCNYNVTVNYIAISGNLTYHNGGQTLGNVTLTLDDGVNPVLTTTTAPGTGAYGYSNLCAGNYTLSANFGSKPVGGINATDAAQTNYWGTTPWSIEKVRFYAGDAVLNNYLDAADASRILSYFVTAGSPAMSHPWKFWVAGETISANQSLPPVLQIPTITIGGGDATINLLGQVTGDFNMSYSGASKGASESLVLKDGKNIFAEVGSELELPIVAGMDMDLGAVSLILNFPSDKVEISDVFLTSDPTSPVMYNISGDELRIGWNSLIPAYLDKGESLITLYMKVTNESGEEGISLSLAADPLNELADGDFFVINDAVLIADVIHTSALGIANNVADRLALANHPNPFKGTTNFVYSLPIDGRVILEIYDLVGNKVMTAVDEAQTAGEYTVELQTNRLQPGVYTATLRLSNEDSKLVRTIKILSR